MFPAKTPYRLSTSTRLLVALVSFASTVILLALGSRALQQGSFDLSRWIGKGRTQPKALFYDSIGMAPKASKKDLAAAALVDEDARFTVELKAAGSKEEAEKVLAMLNELGIKAYYSTFQSQGHVVYRIRKGIYKSRQEAADAAAALARNDKVSATVVKL